MKVTLECERTLDTEKGKKQQEKACNNSFEWIV